MDFDEYINRKINEVEEELAFENSEIKELETYGYKDVDTGVVKDFYHTTLYLKKIKNGYKADLIGTGELKTNEKIFLSSKIHSVHQAKDLIELCGELDSLIKKFEHAHTL